eukprot:UN10840
MESNQMSSLLHFWVFSDEFSAFLGVLPSSFHPCPSTRSLRGLEGSKLLSHDIDK